MDRSPLDYATEADRQYEADRRGLLRGLAIASLLALPFYLLVGAAIWGLAWLIN